MEISRQLIVVERARLHTTELAEPNEGVALFNEDGTPFTGRDQDFAPLTTATAIGTAAKAIASPEPEANTIVPIKFTNGNSASSPTVSFNSGSPRSIMLGGTAATGAKCTIAANGVGFFLFDGSQLHQLGAYT